MYQITKRLFLQEEDEMYADIKAKMIGRMVAQKLLQVLGTTFKKITFVKGRSNK